MTSSIKVNGLSKVFTIAENGGSASLIEALQLGNRQTKMREICALNNINFNVTEGERLGVIGPNGAGKTTLLSLLAGLTQPTAGCIQVEGDVHAMLTIGAVLREDMTGRENIILDATVHGRSPDKIDEYVEELIEFTELGEFIERPVRTYSSGMKARLAFSMGAFINPDILILDETLSVGDVFFSQKASQRMKDVAASGRIVILVTHSTGAIVEMCTRCLWIDNGKIVMDGDPREVTTAYENAVRKSDEGDLKRKFVDAVQIEKRLQIGHIESVHILQCGKKQQARVAAQQALTFQIKGTMKVGTGGNDLQISILRVDGREIWRHSLSLAGQKLPDDGNFDLHVTMDPFILGADLYRVDIGLCDGVGVFDTAIRVFEVVDEEGQHGGKPLLLYDPGITVKKITESYT